MSGGRSCRAVRPGVLLALVLFAFWRPLFAGGSLLPDDQLWRDDPWNGVAPAGVEIQIADRGPVGHHSEWVAWAEDVRNGTFTWWQDAGAGNAFLAGGLPFTHLAYLVVPDWYAPGMVAAVAVLTAAWGAMVLTDRRSRGGWPGLLSGVIYGFSGPMWASIGSPELSAAALVPWVVAAAVDTAEHPRARPITRLALLVGLQAWCGAQSVTIFTVLAASGWVAVSRSERSRWRSLVPGTGILAGLALAAPHLWVHWAWWRWADTDSWETLGSTALPLRALSTTVIGGALGDERAGVAWIAVGSLPSSTLFVGVVGVFLATRGRLPGAGDGAPLVVGVIALAIIVLGGAVERVFGQVVGVPLFVADARPVLMLAVAVAAGHGIERFISETEGQNGRAEGSRTRNRVGSVVGALAGLSVAAAWLQAAIAADAVRAVAPLAFGSALVAMLCLGLSAVARAGHVTGRGAAAALVALAAYELVTFGTRIPTVTDRSLRPDATAAHARLDASMGPFDRIAGDHAAFPADTAARFGHHDVRSPGLRSSGEVSALQAVDPTIVRRSEGGGPFAPVVRDTGLETDYSRHPTWNLLGVDFWVLPPDAAPPGPRRYPAVDGRQALSTRGANGFVRVPAYGLRAVVVDLEAPAETIVHVAVGVGSETVEATVRLRRPVDGPTALPLPGEHLPAGTRTPVRVATLEDGASVRVGTADGVLVTGTVGGEVDSVLVTTEGVLVVHRPTPRVVWEGPGNAVVEVLDERPGSLVVEVETLVDGRLRSDVVDAPGWTVRLDGSRITHIREGGTVIAVEVPAGIRAVTIEYRPPALAVTGTVSGLVMTLLLLWLVIDECRRRNAPRRSGGAGSVEACD